MVNTTPWNQQPIVQHQEVLCRRMAMCPLWLLSYCLLDAGSMKIRCWVAIAGMAWLLSIKASCTWVHKSDNECPKDALASPDVSSGMSSFTRRLHMTSSAIKTWRRRIKPVVFEPFWRAILC
jgi:hypothetical protein